MSLQQPTHGLEQDVSNHVEEGDCPDCHDHTAYNVPITDEMIGIATAGAENCDTTDGRSAERGRSDSFGGNLGELAFALYLDRFGISWSWCDGDDTHTGDMLLGGFKTCDVKTRDWSDEEKTNGNDMAVRDDDRKSADADVYAQVIIAPSCERATVTGWVGGDTVRDAGWADWAQTNDSREILHDDLRDMTEFFKIFP